MEGTVFEGRVSADLETGCLEWTGPVNTGGYGYLEYDGRQVLAHRLSVTLLRGINPGKRHVLHRCDNPRCVNPDHLFLGDARTNFEDAVRKGRHPGRVPDWGVKKPRVRKLTHADVRLIRQSDISARELRLLFGVVSSTIYDIRNRKRKKDVPDDGPVTDIDELRHEQRGTGVSGKEDIFDAGGSEGGAEKV